MEVKTSYPKLKFTEKHKNYGLSLEMKMFENNVCVENCEALEAIWRQFEDGRQSLISAYFSFVMEISLINENKMVCMTA